MFRRFYYILFIVFLGYLFTAGVSNADDAYTGMGRLPGAWIANYKGTKTITCTVGSQDPNCKDGTKEISCTPGDNDSECKRILLGNCDPKADPALDTVPGKPSYQKSCISQNIDRNNFTVKVKFHPKQPTTDLSGNAWGSVSVSVPGGPAFPGSYITSSSGTKTFYLSTCSGLTVPVGSTCTNITTVYAGNSSITVAGKTFTYSGGVGGDVSYNGSTVYLPPVSQKVPTSGAVQTQLEVSGVSVTTKCKSTSTGLPVQSTRQPTSASDSCDSGATPIVDGNGALISTAVPVMVDLVYPSTITASITTDGVTQCTRNTTQQYTSGKYVRDKLCAPVKDYNRCTAEGTVAANCARYVTGGGDIYDANGILMTAQGDAIVSVQGASTTTTSPSSLFGMVFGNVPARTYAISGSTLAEINNINEKSAELKVGDDPKPIPGTEKALVNFQLRYEGEYACVYAYGQDASNEWRVEGDYPKSLRQVYDFSGETPAMNVEDQPLTSELTGDLTPAKTSYCVYAPPPSVDNEPLVWNSLISPICTNYNTSSSQFLDSKGKRRSFTGVVVECIEDTMMGVFYPTASAGGGNTKTFFSSMQEKLKSAIRAVIALFVVLFGYRLMINKKVPDRKEWTWTMLKLALVIYFAAGPGMVNLFPKMLSITKNLSLIVMQAGLGIVTDNGITAAQSAASGAYNAVNTAQSAIDSKNNEISQVNSQLSSISTQLTTLNTQIAAATVTKDSSLAIKNNLASLLSSAQSSLTSYNNTRQTRINTINSAISTLNSQIASITSTINSQTSQIADYNSQITQLSTNITNLESTVNSQKTNFQTNNTSRTYASPGSGTSKIPSFCTSARIKVWGAGGSGYIGGSGDGDGSGAAGGYIEETVTVTAGSSVSYTVGSGATNESSKGNNSTASYSTITWTAYGGNGGRSGTSTGGSAARTPSGGAATIQNGGNGESSHGSCHPGGAAYGSSVVGCNPNNCAYDIATPFGSGGCSWDNHPWGKGGNGKVIIECTNFNFTNLSNIDTSDTTATTLKNNINNLAALKNSLSSDTAALQSQIDTITAQRTANQATLAQYQADLSTNTQQLTYIQNNTSESISQSNDLVSSLQAQYAAADAQYNTDLAAYNSLNSSKTSLLSQQTTLNSQLTALQAQLATLQSNLTTAQQNYNSKQQAYNNLLTGGSLSQITQNNTGYSYCDFRAHTYKSGKEYIQLWDMLDCKISKYLGIGDNASSSDIPQVFVIAMLAPISSAYGIPIFILSIIFLVTIVMITVRMVHIYIMAFLAMLLLVFISPLVIPSVFFEATKHMFTQWMQQLMAYWLQPVILFAFLSFMFAAIDSVMFGSNQSFSADNKIQNSAGVVTPSNTKCGTSSPASASNDSVCKDKYAPGYLYQILKFNKTSYPTSDFPIISVYTINFGSDEGKYLCIGLVKLLVISFIVHSMLSLLQDMSAKFTGAMVGADTLSAAPVASPATVLAGISSAGSASKNLFESSLSGAKQTAHAIKHYKSTYNTGKRAVLNSAPVRGGRAAYQAGKWMSDKYNEFESKRVSNQAKNIVGDMLRKEGVANEKKGAEEAHKLMATMANKGAQRAADRTANEKARQDTENDPGMFGMFERNSAEAEAIRAERAERKGINTEWENNKGNKDVDVDFGVGKMFGDAEREAAEAEVLKNGRIVESAREERLDSGQQLDLKDGKSDDNSKHYEVLGIKEGATAREIDLAYRKKARELHPDKNKSEGATERMAQVNYSYETLKEKLESGNS